MTKDRRPRKHDSRVTAPSPTRPAFNITRQGIFRASKSMSLTGKRGMREPEEAGLRDVAEILLVICRGGERMDVGMAWMAGVGVELRPAGRHHGALEGLPKAGGPRDRAERLTGGRPVEPLPEVGDPLQPTDLLGSSHHVVDEDPAPRPLGAEDDGVPEGPGRIPKATLPLSEDAFREEGIREPCDGHLALDHVGFESVGGRAEALPADPDPPGLKSLPAAGDGGPQILDRQVFRGDRRIAQDPGSGDETPTDQLLLAAAVGAPHDPDPALRLLPGDCQCV